MLDRTVFLREMAVLAELFNRPALSEVLITRYYAFLNERLSTSEFELAARRVFEEERFWPAPVTFVTLAKGDPAAAAESAWDELIALAARGEGRSVTPEQLATLRRIGVTFRDIETATEYRLAEIGKRFRGAHARSDESELIAIAYDRNTTELL